MDSEHIKTRLEIVWIQLRLRLKRLLRIVGIAIVFLGAINLFGPAFGIAPIELYPRSTLIISERAAIYLSDVVVMVGGTILAWFV